MAQNPRGQNDSRNERNHDRSNLDSRRQNISSQRMSPEDEEDVSRGKGRKEMGRSSILSSIDYDRNAE